MTLTLIEIRGAEAESRRVTQKEHDWMVNVREKLSRLYETTPLKKRPEKNFAEAHHLVYLANREALGMGDHENTTHKTPLLIADGEEHHKMAFNAFGYNAKTAKLSEIQQTPAKVAVTEDKLTPQNAAEVVRRLAGTSELQIHRINQEIDPAALTVPGWETRIEMYVLETPHEGKFIEK